jgi:hypothetical protein
MKPTITDQEAIAAFLQSRQPTKCPTAFVLPTKGANSDGERAELRKYHADRDAEIVQRMSKRQQLFAR